MIFVLLLNACQWITVYEKIHTFFYFRRAMGHSLLEFRLDWPEIIYTLPQQPREFFEFFAKVECHDCKSAYDRFKEKTNRWN